jgi:hypothetical protein
VLNQTELGHEEFVASPWSLLVALGYHRVTVEYVVELHLVEAHCTQSDRLEIAEFAVKYVFGH